MQRVHERLTSKKVCTGMQRVSERLRIQEEAEACRECRKGSGSRKVHSAPPGLPHPGAHCLQGHCSREPKPPLACTAHTTASAPVSQLCTKLVHTLCACLIVCDLRGNLRVRLCVQLFPGSPWLPGHEIGAAPGVCGCVPACPLARGHPPHC